MNDHEEIAALLHIHEKTSAYGQSLSNIRDAAWQKLLQHNASHAGPPKPSTYVPTAFDKVISPTSGDE